MNKWHSPSIQFRMTEEYAVAACIMITNAWRRNKQEVRHDLVGQAIGLQCIGAQADFVRQVLRRP